jgi:predicted RNA binding protein with dsRBD fold (UPF0201 family)
MSKSIIKPKASVIWSEQTEKLKKKIASLVDNLCFEQDKMEQMLLKLHDQSGSGKHEIFEIHKI